MIQQEIEQEKQLNRMDNRNGEINPYRELTVNNTEKQKRREEDKAIIDKRLSEKSMKYCGILPYFGSSSYLYQRMPMGLNISPSIWQSYINAILNCLQSKKYCEAIMDDLILFTPSKESHTNKLEDIIESFIKEWIEDIT